MVGITEVMSITIVSIESISISLWLSISRSLAIVSQSMVGIWVSIVSVSMVGITKVGSIAIVAIESISISLWLSFSSNSCEEAEGGNGSGFHFKMDQARRISWTPH